MEGGEGKPGHVQDERHGAVLHQCLEGEGEVGYQCLEGEGGRLRKRLYKNFLFERSRFYQPNIYMYDWICSKYR